LIILGILNVDYYFNHYYPPLAEFELVGAEARYEAALGTDYRIFTVAETWRPYDPETNQYLIHGQEGGNILNPAVELPLPATENKGLAFIFAAGTEQNASTIRTFYPGGTEGEVMSHAGERLFSTYLLTPAQEQAIHGLQLQLTTPGGKTLWSGQVDGMGRLPQNVGLTFPLKALWSGAVYVPQAGNYTIKLAGASLSSVAVFQFDNRPVELERHVLVGPGWHRLVVGGTLARPADLTLLLGRTGTPVAEVSRWQFWPRLREENQ